MSGNTHYMYYPVKNKVFENKTIISRLDVKEIRRMMKRKAQRKKKTIRKKKPIKRGQKGGFRFFRQPTEAEAKQENEIRLAFAKALASLVKK